jgi:hypothetical protein
MASRNKSIRIRSLSHRARVHFALEPMKIQFHFRGGFLALGLLHLVFSTCASAQATGGIDFTAHVTPTDARPEPVRQLTFSLLRKSLSDIRAEVARRDPAPNLDEYIDGLKVSPEFKGWMKKNQTVQLSGGDFAKQLTADDVMDIPELNKAYMSRNSGFEGIGFPKPKYREKDRIAAPEKYKQQKDEFTAAVKKFITATPESVQGIDADLKMVNPYEKWSQILEDRNRRLEKATLDLAQRNYLVKQTDTDLNGHGTFSSLAPGEYWIGTLGTWALAGDVRLRWDLPVTIHANEVIHLDLTNLNAVDPHGESLN